MENFTQFLTVQFGVKAFLILFVVFYLVYSVLIIRQVQLMEEAFTTKLAPVLKFISIVNAGVAAALFFLTIGIL